MQRRGSSGRSVLDGGGEDEGVGDTDELLRMGKPSASSRGPTNHFTVFHGKMSLINNSLNNYIYM